MIKEDLIDDCKELLFDFESGVIPSIKKIEKALAC